MPKRIATLCILAALAILFAWQRARENQMKACEVSGGVWHGKASQCEPRLPGPLLKRDLERG